MYVDSSSNRLSQKGRGHLCKKEPSAANRKGSDAHAQGDAFLLKVTNTRPAPL